MNIYEVTLAKNPISVTSVREVLDTGIVTLHTCDYTQVRRPTSTGKTNPDISTRTLGSVALMTPARTLGSVTQVTHVVLGRKILR